MSQLKLSCIFSNSALRALAPLAIAACAIPVGPALAETDEQAELAEQEREDARIAEILARDEMVWLRANQDNYRVATTARGGVYAVGYFREDEISEELLDALGEHSIKPNVTVVETGTERFRPIELVYHHVLGHPAARCVSLVQIVRGRSARSGPDNSREHVQQWADSLPARPLTPECNLGGIPPMPEGFLERQEFRGDDPVLREAPRSCDDFPALEPQSMNLVPGMRIDFRSIAVGDTMPRTEYHSPNQHFSVFGGAFAAALYRSGLHGIELMPYGNYMPRAADLTIELRLIDDPVADEFCYVADIAQGASKQRFMRRIPREGRALKWDNSEKPDFEPSRIVSDFGQHVAETMLAQQ